MKKEINQLLKIVNNAKSSKRARYDAACTLLSIIEDGVWKPTPEQYRELMWTWHLDAPDEVKAAREAAREAERAAQKAAEQAEEDASFQHCATCFRKEPIGTDACSRCGRDEWIIPSVLKITTPGAARFGELDQEGLTKRIYDICSRDEEKRVREARELLRIFDACGWQYPALPYGKWPNQFVLPEAEPKDRKWWQKPEAEEILPKPKVGYWSVSYQDPSNNFQPRQPEGSDDWPVW